MQTLTFNDGTTVDGTIMPDGYGQQIYVYLTGMNLMQGFMLLSDPTKTGRIVATSYETETVFEGYTELSAINNQFGNCNATLRKVVNAE